MIPATFAPKTIHKKSRGYPEYWEEIVAAGAKLQANKQTDRQAD